MRRFEYKVIPAPKKGKRGKGVRGSEGKFANALQNIMNDHGADGWEYIRTDTLPSEERTGLTGRTTVFQNMLVFRRELEDGEVAEEVAVVDNISDDESETDDGPEEESEAEVEDEKPAPTIESVMKEARSETAGSKD